MVYTAPVPTDLELWLYPWKLDLPASAAKVISRPALRAVQHLRLLRWVNA